MNKKSLVWPIILILSGIILFIVLMYYSFDTVDTLNFGLIYDSVLRRVLTNNGSNSIYPTGLYYVGPGRSMINFPLRRLNIIISNNANDDSLADYSTAGLNARTQDGIPILVEVFCQIKLIEFNQTISQSDLQQIQNTFLSTMQYLSMYNSSLRYLEDVTTILQTNILDTVSLFNSDSIFTNRQDLGVLLTSQFQSSMDQFGFKVPVLIITNIEFRNNLIVNAIEQTQILNQNILQTSILQNSIILQLNYTQQVNNFDNLNSINSITTQAQVNMITSNGTAVGMNSAYTNIASGIKNIQSVLGNDTETINFLIYMAVFKNMFSQNQTLLLTNDGFF